MQQTLTHNLKKFQTLKTQSRIIYHFEARALEIPNI